MKAVLLDVDGTIFPLSAVVKALQKACLKMKIKPFTKKQVYTEIIGYRLSETFPKIYPQHAGKADEFRKNYYDFYRKLNPKPFPNTIKTLKKLREKKVKIGIITTTGREKILPLLEKNKIFYNCLITSTDVEKIKPDPEPVLLAMKKLRVSGKQAFFIGDHKFDMIAAKNAGCTAIGITTGSGRKQELLKAGADYVINDILEVLEIVK